MNNLNFLEHFKYKVESLLLKSKPHSHFLKSPRDDSIYELYLKFLSMNIFCLLSLSNIILKASCNFSCDINGLYPPEMTRNALDNPKCSNVLHRLFDRTRSLHPLN